MVKLRRCQLGASVSYLAEGPFVSSVPAVMRSRVGHTTSRYAANGPRNSVKRNQVQADLLRVRA